MGTSICIIILVLYICQASILRLYQHKYCFYLFKLITTITDQLLVIYLVKVLKNYRKIKERKIMQFQTFW